MNQLCTDMEHFLATMDNFAFLTQNKLCTHYNVKKISSSQLIIESSYRDFLCNEKVVRI